jgi:hypothetical protein
MAIYRIDYVPVERSGPSFLNAPSHAEAVRFAGAGLPAWAKALVVVREVRPDETPGTAQEKGSLASAARRRRTGFPRKTARIAFAASNSGRV